MKYISTVLSVIALALIALLFFQMSGLKKAEKSVQREEPKGAAGNTFRIAYFDMDSLEAHYDYFKFAQEQVKAKENSNSMELASMDQDNQKKIQAWRQKGNAMTQAEGEQAQQEYAAMQQNFQRKRQTLESELYKRTEDFKADIRKRIEDYLKEYNKQKNYSFIFAYDPSTFIYSRDSSYNITSDLLSGLNEAYQKEKPKKK
jgi:outer membrane protein